MKLDDEFVQNTVLACGEGFVTMTMPIEFPPHDGETIKADYVVRLSHAQARLCAKKLSHMAEKLV